MTKRHVDDMSGYCRTPGHDDHGHRLCSWGTGVETPSAVVTCICPCHRQNGDRVMVPKGSAVGSRMVPKK